MFGLRRGPNNIKIVYFAQQVLHMLQVVRPSFVLYRKEVFNNVAKAFDADAESVPCHLRAVAKCNRVQLACGGPSFQCEMLKDGTPQANARGALGQRITPLPPLLSVEFFKGCTSFALLLDFASLKDFEHRVRRIRSWGRVRSERCRRRRKYWFNGRRIFVGF